jgi:hypothetical protein
MTAGPGGTGKNKRGAPAVPGQLCRASSVGKGHAGLVRLERAAGARQLRQDSWDGTAETGQTGQDSQDRTARTHTARISQPEQDNLFFSK